MGDPKNFDVDEINKYISYLNEGKINQYENIQSLKDKMKNNLANNKEVIYTEIIKAFITNSGDINEIKVSGILKKKCF